MNFPNIYGPKYSRSKIDQHSNLSSSVDSTVTDWSRKTIVWTVLNHIVVYQSQLGTSLSNEQNSDTVFPHIVSAIE